LLVVYVVADCVGVQREGLAASIRPSWVDFYLQTEPEFSLRNVVFKIKNRTMGNVQKHKNCINVPLSQSFRSYLKLILYLMHSSFFVFIIISVICNFGRFLIM
jgi:hypothetical protein